MWMQTNLLRAAECASRRLEGKGDFISEALAKAIPGSLPPTGGRSPLFLEFPSDIVKQTFSADGAKTSRVYFDSDDVSYLSEAELATKLEQATRHAFESGMLHRA